MNGAYFSMSNIFSNFCKVQYSRHSFYTKFIHFPLSLFHSYLMKLVSYIAVGLTAVLHTIVLQEIIERFMKPSTEDIDLLAEKN
jgi:hypothetical protein